MAKLAKKLTKRQQKIKEIKEQFKGQVAPKEAIAVLKKFSKEACTKKSPQTFELSVQLGVDTKANDQQVRASVSLPAGTGKVVRVAVLAKGEKVAAAKAAGAVDSGTEELVKRIEEGWMDFDVLVASPECMPMLGKLGRVLGPRGLMPNPKDGTVTPDVVKAVKELQAGKVSFRTEKTGAVVHMPFGNSNFTDEDLLKNLQAAMQEIQKSKPSASKGTYFKSTFISITQGPGLELSAEAVLTA